MAAETGPQSGDVGGGPDQPPEGRLFNVRRLVALDMGLHGRTFILAEFTFGVALGAVLGASLILGRQWVVGAYVLTLGINYLPVLAYAILLRNDYGRVVNMNSPDIGRMNRKYSIQQFLIFIPFFTLVLAITQRSSGRRRRTSSQAAGRLRVGTDLRAESARL